MFAYPAQFPVDETKTLIGLLRGGAVNTAEDVRCAWVVAGYGLGQMLPANPVTGAGRVAVPVATAPQAATALERALTATDESAKTAALAAIPWQQIVQVILALVQAWLNQQ